MEFPRLRQGEGNAAGSGHGPLATSFDNAGYSILPCSRNAANYPMRQMIRWENLGCNVIYLARTGLRLAALTHQFGEPSYKEA
jgi:hypothetical protein